MSMSGEQSDWSTIVAVVSVAVGCVLFVINQVNVVRKEMEEKINSIKRNITRVEDETSRKIGTTHTRIDKVEADVKTNEKYLFDNIVKLKDQFIEFYKNK